MQLNQHVQVPSYHKQIHAAGNTTCINLMVQQQTFNKEIAKLLKHQCNVQVVTAETCTYFIYPDLLKVNWSVSLGGRVAKFIMYICLKYTNLFQNF